MPTDAFISFAEEDKDIAEKICNLFDSRDIKCWLYHKEISVDPSYPERIVTAIKECRFFILFITKNTSQSEDVKNELKMAHDYAKKVIPFRVDNASVPDDIKYFIGRTSFIEASSSRIDEGINILLNIVIDSIKKQGAEIIADSNVVAVERRLNMPIGGSSIPLPCYFPAISSVKTQLPPLEYLQVLKAFEHPQLLISAYDIYNSRERERKKIELLLSSLYHDNVSILLDSGHYERFWKEDSRLEIDKKNKWNKNKYWDVLKSGKFHLSFCYDKHASKHETKVLINNLENDVLTDQKKSNQGTIIPIIHGDAKRLPEITLGVVRRLNPPLIAVAERELGDGILMRAQTVLNIRNALNKMGQYYPLHLLGTGNPLSLLIYVMAGADSFDGLEWCQTTVNHENTMLYHFQQRELFGMQSKFCSMSDISYAHATLGHNLLFYRKWMENIQSALETNTMTVLLEKQLPLSFLNTLNAELPGVIS
jgi:queuine/archaeosine tRNA-ribosyltransferase